MSVAQAATNTNPGSHIGASGCATGSPIYYDPSNPPPRSPSWAAGQDGRRAVDKVWWPWRVGPASGPGWPHERVRARGAACRRTAGTG